MAVAAEDEHEAELVDTGGVTVARLWFPISLKACNTAVDCTGGEGLLAGCRAREGLLIVCLEVSHMSTSLHLLIVQIKALISILNDKGVLHRN